MMILATKGYYQWEFQDPNMEVLYQKSQVFKKKSAATGMGLAFFEPLGHPQNIWEQKGNENEHHPFLVAHPS